MNRNISAIESIIDSTGEISICKVHIPTLMSRFVLDPGPDHYSVRRAVRITEEHLHEPILNAGEMKLLNGFKTMKKQMEWIAGRYAAKTLALHRNMAESALDITIRYKEKGVPYLESAPDYSLSISHSGDHAVAGIHLNSACTIGIDVEKIQPDVSPEFTETAFTADEKRMLSGCSNREIYIHWTAKEAFMKLIGKGFHESLKSLEYIDGRFHYNNQLFFDINIHLQIMDETYSLTVLSAARKFF